MGDIVYFKGTSPKDHEPDVDPDQVLEGSKGCTEVVVIGLKDNEFYAAASGLEVADVLYYLRRAEHVLMQIIDEIEQ